MPVSTTAALAVPGAPNRVAELTVLAKAALGALGALPRAKSPKRRSSSLRTLARARDRRLRTAASLSSSRGATCCELWPSR
ncbi:hypothetical protein KW5_0121545 [Xanthomonas vasicola pv. vasculorum NCPPB 1326]|nr:hypothetical protein KW5_0121545 [Xanthomonas vasicola pv. vasculorum NCPPB 1326]KFA26713.1 hypothetical protein KWG_0123250 [Xanthomonas vasicola pv. vasculorum NCPPB 1381]